MKVRIEEGCIACGACESVCEEVFTVDDTVHVNEGNIAGNEESVKEAAESCPVNVIIVEE
jgi:ferredoxin